MENLLIDLTTETSSRSFPNAVTIQTLIENIRTRTNKTWIVPTCESQVRIGPQSPRTPDQVGLLNVRTRQGSIRIFNSEATANPDTSTFYSTDSYSTETGEHTFTTTRSSYPSDDSTNRTTMKQSGIRILQRSHDKIVELVTSKYGKPTDTGHVYVIFNVRPSPGVPGGKWIYT